MGVAVAQTAHRSATRRRRAQPTLPTVDQLLARAGLDPRALEVLRSMDLTSKRLLLWVPGTNEQETPDGIAHAIDEHLAGVPVVRMPYEQSWSMRTSVPDGVRVLADVLRGVSLLRERGALRGELLLAGHSQGSWVISEALTDPLLAAQVHRAVLFSNPGTNPQRHPGPGPLTAPGPVDRVLEISNPRDPIAMRVSDINAALDVVGGPGLLTRARGAVRTLLKDPAYAAAIINRQVRIMLRAYGEGEDPHLYALEARDAVRFLRDGAPALAALQHGPAWGSYAAR